MSNATPFTVPPTFQTFTSPSVMEMVAGKVRELFSQKPAGTQEFMARKSRDAIDRAQNTRAMPTEFGGALDLPEDRRPLPTSENGLYVKTPRLNYTGVDARFAFCIPVEDAQGKTRMRSAKHFMPLFEGTDYSYRPGQNPPVLIIAVGQIQSVEGFVKSVTKSPALLSSFPSVKAADVKFEDIDIKDLVRENGPHRKITTWALTEAAPKRFEVVKVGNELSLLDREQQLVYPSSVLEKGWNVAGLQQQANGLVMVPAMKLELPAGFTVAAEATVAPVEAPKAKRESPGMDI